MKTFMQLCIRIFYISILSISSKAFAYPFDTCVEDKIKELNTCVAQIKENLPESPDTDLVEKQEINAFLGAIEEGTPPPDLPEERKWVECARTYLEAYTKCTQEYMRFSDTRGRRTRPGPKGHQLPKLGSEIERINFIQAITSEVAGPGYSNTLNKFFESSRVFDDQRIWQNGMTSDARKIVDYRTQGKGPVYEKDIYDELAKQYEEDREEYTRLSPRLQVYPERINAFMRPRVDRSNTQYAIRVFIQQVILHAKTLETYLALRPLIFARAEFLYEPLQNANAMAPNEKAIIPQLEDLIKKTPHNEKMSPKPWGTNRYDSIQTANPLLTVLRKIAADPNLKTVSTQAFCYPNDIAAIVTNAERSHMANIFTYNALRSFVTGPFYTGSEVSLSAQHPISKCECKSPFFWSPSGEESYRNTKKIIVWTVCGLPPDAMTNIDNFSIEAKKDSKKYSPIPQTSIPQMCNSLPEDQKKHIASFEDGLLNFVSDMNTNIDKFINFPSDSPPNPDELRAYLNSLQKLYLQFFWVTNLLTNYFDRQLLSDANKQTITSYFPAGNWNAPTALWTRQQEPVPVSAEGQDDKILQPLRDLYTDSFTVAAAIDQIAPDNPVQNRQAGLRIRRSPALDDCIQTLMMQRMQFYLMQAKRLLISMKLYAADADVLMKMYKQYGHPQIAAAYKTQVLDKYEAFNRTFIGKGDLLKISGKGAITRKLTRRIFGSSTFDNKYKELNKWLQTPVPMPNLDAAITKAARASAPATQRQR